MAFRPCWPPIDADHLLVSGAQMAQLEQRLFDSGLPTAALMEKAALALAWRLRGRLRGCPGDGTTLPPLAMQPTGGPSMPSARRDRARPEAPPAESVGVETGSPDASRTAAQTAAAAAVEDAAHWNVGRWNAAHRNAAHRNAGQGSSAAWNSAQWSAAQWEADRCGRQEPFWQANRGVLVLVGPGHNGGDGLVVARELHLAGVPVRLWSPFERHRPLTEAHLRHALWLGIPRLADPPDPEDPALWVDALFGIGQNRPPGPRLETLLEERQRRRPGALVAVDGPTGLCADSGRLLGEGGATAAVTWSIGLLKRGFVQDRALGRVGRLERVDLGLSATLLAELPASTPLVLMGSDAERAPWPPGDAAAAKYGRGRALLVVGSRRYMGAAALALAGASASGCGSLRAALPEELAGDLWQIQPHVVLEASLASDAMGALALEPLRDLDLQRLDALLLGPGLGWPQAPDAVCGRAGPSDIWDLLLSFDGLLVLDADGLNRLADRCHDQPQAACDWLRQRRGSTWLTPHHGEFARLFPRWAELEPLSAAAAAAADSGAAVLLKGARSVVAAPDGRLWQVLEAAAAAARAGLGDTLAGYATGRGAMALAALAEPASRCGPGGPLDAALLAAAVLEHAEAGRRCLRRRGPGGVTPQAVARELERRPMLER